MPARAQDHRVAVVRVDVRAADETVELLIFLLEVGRDATEDRVLGTASTPAAACQLLYDWLSDMMRGMSDVGVTVVETTGCPPGCTLGP